MDLGFKDKNELVKTLTPDAVCYEQFLGKKMRKKERKRI